MKLNFQKASHKRIYKKKKPTIRDQSDYNYRKVLSQHRKTSHKVGMNVIKGKRGHQARDLDRFSPKEIHKWPLGI